MMIIHNYDKCNKYNKDIKNNKNNNRTKTRIKTRKDLEFKPEQELE